MQQNGSTRQTALQHSTLLHPGLVCALVHTLARVLQVGKPVVQYPDASDAQNESQVTSQQKRSTAHTALQQVAVAQPGWLSPWAIMQSPVAVVQMSGCPHEIVSCPSP